MTKTLHLFRHGQTDWNLARRLQGHTDIPLNEEGRRQAQGLQTYFSENPVSLFISSDLLRAQETARIANQNLQKPLHATPALRESRLGELEGKTREEVFSIYGEETWQKWSSIHPDHADFRFPGAESARETVERVLQALTAFCRGHEFISAGVCTHGLVMRRFLHFLNPDLKDIVPVPNCTVYQITYDPIKNRFVF